MQPQILTEKRKHPRRKVTQGVFTVVKSDDDILGEVLDVSEGGLALKYVADFEAGMSGGKLDIFATGGRSYLLNVPVITISDFELPNDVEFSTIRLRRMGVAFEKLTETQKEALNNFIIETKAN